MNLHVKAIGSAVLVSAAALGATFVAAAQLRRRALADSHQLPTPEEWVETPSPTSPALVAAGRKLFLHNCAHCHGIDATGDEGPDLHDVQVSDRYISNLITHGLPHEMPSFAKKLHREEIIALTAYIRSLETTESVSSTWVPTSTPGAKREHRELSLRQAVLFSSAGPHETPTLARKVSPI